MLVNQIWDGAAWVDSSARLENLSGTPLVSVAYNGDGEQLADDYTLTFGAVVPGTSANCTVTPSSPNNPYGGLVARTLAVVLNGVTVHKNVIPGYDLIFSADAGFTGAWSARIHAGQYLGTFDASAGAASAAGVRQRAYNAGTGAVEAAFAGLRTIAVYVKKVGSAFARSKRFAPNATEKTAGGGSLRVMPYVLTVANVAGAGAGKTCDIRVDGVVFPAGSLEDLSAGGNVSGVGLKAIAGQGYRVNAGHVLESFVFYIDPACANGDTANIMIYPSRYRRVASDAAGVVGAYGAADVTLTQTGQSAGVVLAGGFAYYWADVLVPANSNPESNPYPIDVYLAGTETGAGGYLT